MFTRILLTTDFSEAAEKACAVAEKLATCYKGEIVILHVLHHQFWSPYAAPSEELELEHEITQKASELLEQVRERFEQKGIPARAELVVGVPRVEIVQAARRLNAHVIIIASHGHSGLYEMVIGSTTDRVVRQATCPVLVASSFMEDVESADFERVLFPTDLSDGSNRHAETVVFGLAPRLKELHLLTVLHPPIAVPVLPGELPITIEPQEDKELAENATERLEAVKTRLERLNPDVKVLTAVRYGASVVDEILQYRAENDLHLIAMPANRHSIAEPHYIGMVTERVLKTARVPVLVLK